MFKINIISVLKPTVAITNIEICLVTSVIFLEVKLAKL